MIYHNKARVFILLSILLLTTACTDEPATSRKHSAAAHYVDIARATNKQVSVEKTLPGTLQATREVHIFNQQAGLLTSLRLYAGDQVKQGDIIATLDDALIQAELNKAQAIFKQKKVDLKRLQNLAAHKLTAESEIAQAQTAVEIAQADLKLHEIRMAHTKITAPFTGIVSQRLLEPDNVIPLHSHILSIIDVSQLKSKIYVSELLLPLMQKNDRVSIKIDALGERVFNGRVIRSHPTIDANTRRGVIEVSLQPLPPGAMPGQLSRITLKTISKTRLMVPFDAVRHDNMGAYVYRIEDNKARRIYIRTGIQNQREIEVLAGIKEHDRVIINGFFGLKDNKIVVEKTIQ
jgi:membrane fusion protein (multidrug efflux system)